MVTAWLLSDTLSSGLLCKRSGGTALSKERFAQWLCDLHIRCSAVLSRDLFDEVSEDDCIHTAALTGLTGEGKGCVWGVACFSGPSWSVTINCENIEGAIYLQTLPLMCTVSIQGNFHIFTGERFISIG